MKAKQILMVLGFIGCISLLGFTRCVAQDAEVDISLPYSGNYNYWTITFTSVNYPGTQYTFYTDDDNYDPNGGYEPLGTVPTGTYNIEYTSAYEDNFFDYGVITSPDYAEYEEGHGYDFIYYNAPIADGSILTIDYEQ